MRGEADIRADIYSLGCTLYYLLTGGPPFQGTSLYDILQAHHSMEATPLNLVRPEVPVELAALVAKMMAKEPERRFQEPKEVAQALKPFFKTGSEGLLGSKPDRSRAGRAAASTGANSTQPVAGAASTLRIDPTAVPPKPAPISSNLIDLRVAEPLYDSLLDSPRRSAASAKRQGPGAALTTIANLAGHGRRAWWVIAAVLFLGCAIAWAAVVFRVKTRNGVIVLDNVPQNAVVEVDGDRITVTPTGGQPVKIEVQPGKHGVVVKRGEDVLLGESVAIASGREFKLSVRPEPHVVSGPEIAPASQPGPREAGSAVVVTLDDPSEPVNTELAMPRDRDATPPRLGQVETPEPGFKSLFNGRDLAGWTAFSNSKKVGPAALARVSGGEIILGPPKGDGGLRTNRTYRDFILKLEYLFPIGGIFTNPGSGVIILPESHGGLTYQQGIEYQIRTGESGDLWAFAGASLVGQDWRGKLGKVPRKLDAEKPPGQWNAVVIRCEGSRTTYELNGREVNRAESPTPISGWITLMSQGSVIRFRNVAIHELSTGSKGPAAPRVSASRPRPVVGKWRHASGSPSATGGGIIKIAPDGSILNAQGVARDLVALRLVPAPPMAQQASTQRRVARSRGAFPGP